MNNAADDHAALDRLFSCSRHRSDVCPWLPTIANTSENEEEAGLAHCTVLRRVCKQCAMSVVRPDFTTLSRTPNKQGYNSPVRSLTLRQGELDTSAYIVLPCWKTSELTCVCYRSG